MTLFFCGSNPEQIGYLKCVLLCFEVVPGLKINLNKYELVPISEVPLVSTLAIILRCKISRLPLK